MKFCSRLSEHDPHGDCPGVEGFGTKVEAELEKFGPPNSKLLWHQTLLMASALRREIKRASAHVARSYDPAAAIRLRAERLSWSVETLRITVRRLSR